MNPVKMAFGKFMNCFMLTSTGFLFQIEKEEGNMLTKCCHPMLIKKKSPFS